MAKGKSSTSARSSTRGRSTTGTARPSGGAARTTERRRTKPTKTAAARNVPKPAPRKNRPQAVSEAAMPRSMQNRGVDDTRKAVQPVRALRPASFGVEDQPLTRIHQETEVRGTETRVERVVEHAEKPPVPDVDRTAGRGRYVYCIIGATQPMKFGGIGMDEQWPDVYTINYKEVAAVVSDVPIMRYDPTRENVLAHERVNETVMRDHTVIPMSFGTIFKTKDDIVELMRSAYEAFADVLNKMQNKLEFGLKVLWDRDEMVKLIEQEDEDIHRLRSEISSQKGSTYFARMQYGRMIDAALQHRSERYVAEFLNRLRDVSVASRVNRAIGDKMIMNAAFLVQREQEPAFDRRIKEIASNYEKLTFKYTGPWPPYNFVNIRLKLERAGQP
jgi:hypothetical protein